MNGWSGVIINGAVVNGQMLISQPFGIFASGSAQMRCQSNNGHKGGNLAFGNVQFTRGHYVYADKDGIVTSQQEVSNGQFGSGGMHGGATQTGTAGGFPSSNRGFGGMAPQQNLQNFGGNNGFNRSGGTNPASQFGGGFGGANSQSGFGGASSMGGMSNTMSNGMSGRQSNSFFSKGSSNSYSNRGSFNKKYGSYNSKKKPNKRTLLGAFCLILAVVWLVCLPDS